MSLYTLNPKWQKIIDKIDFAFQPIIHPKSAHTFALEALLRNNKSAGFEKIDDLFEAAYTDNVLFDVDLALREIVYSRFRELDFYKKIKIFYNYDHRTMEMPNYNETANDKLIKKYDLDYDALCLELTEKYRNKPEILNQMHQQSKNLGFKIAIDDFGAIFAGYELLYYSEPEFVKIDRFLITDIDKDNKKKSFCGHIVSLSHLMGISVIAEGIETEEEFYACRDIDVDLFQGFFVQSPTVNTSELTFTYKNISNLYEKNLRIPDYDARLIAKKSDPVDGININAEASQIYALLDKWRNFNHFAILDNNHFPIGIIDRKNITEVLSLYPTMIQALERSNSIRMLTKKCPVIDINISLDRLLEIFVTNASSPAVIIISNLKYFGLLNSTSLLAIINDKNMVHLREYNQLTHLPGFNASSKYLDLVLMDDKDTNYIIYFDFNNFGQFNNKFGFRQGDRIISIFSELLRKTFSENNSFIGHFGGDDFFVSLPQKKRNNQQIREMVIDLNETFFSIIRSHFNKAELEQKTYFVHDKEGQKESVPLLNSQAVVIQVPSENLLEHKEDMQRELKSLKHKAQHSKDGIILVSLKNKTAEAK
jgi:EAL domain-containing protein (putative c-di-GMP-specific phosphodiesterase class I)/GGDEF domain-containing protein